MIGFRPKRCQVHRLGQASKTKGAGLKPTPFCFVAAPEPRGPGARLLELEPERQLDGSVVVVPERPVWAAVLRSRSPRRSPPCFGFSRFGRASRPRGTRLLTRQVGRVSELTVVLRPLMTTALNALNTSTRNCKRRAPPRRMLRASARSTRCDPGSRQDVAARLQADAARRSVRSRWTCRTACTDCSSSRPRIAVVDDASRRSRASRSGSRCRRGLVAVAQIVAGYRNQP